MSLDFARAAQIARIQNQQREAEYEARRKFFNRLTPAQLTRHLAQNLEIPAAPADDKALAAVLQRQMQVLDTVFMTALHQAGLGHSTQFGSAALAEALLAQRLCRQTYDSVKKYAAAKKSAKQTEGQKNCQQ